MSTCIDFFKINIRPSMASTINASLGRKTLHMSPHVVVVNNLRRQYVCARDTSHRRTSSFKRQCTRSDSNPTTLREAMSEISDGIRQGTVAVGSGDLVAAFLEHMADRDDIGDVTFAPTSLSVESELKMLGLPRVSEAQG